MNWALETTDTTDQSRAPMPAAPSQMGTLAARYDPAMFDPRRRQTRMRLVVRGENTWDVALSTLPSGHPGGPDAVGLDCRMT